MSAYDGEEALKQIKCFMPSLIILDIMMPKLNGLEVCKEVGKKSSVPIIMLTAKGEEIDRILGLELGADDYIVKPFSPREVVARIKAIRRRIIKVVQEVLIKGMDFGATIPNILQMVLFAFVWLPIGIFFYKKTFADVMVLDIM